jgi:hypothetical protein
MERADNSRALFVNDSTAVIRLSTVVMTWVTSKRSTESLKRSRVLWSLFEIQMDLCLGKILIGSLQKEGIFVYHSIKIYTSTRYKYKKIGDNLSKVI